MQWLWRWMRHVPDELWFILALIVVYLYSAIRDLPFYRYQMNPDGISYFDISRMYLNGHAWEAVNAYWGPLLSWLMAPVMKLGLEPISSFKVVSFAIGLVIIVGVYALSRRYMRAWLAAVMTVIASTVVYGWAVAGYITPDLLLAAWLLWYVYCFTSERFMQSRWMVFVTGLLAGGAYLTKSYALPFFLLHFGSYMAWRWWRRRSERSRTMRQFVWGLAGFCLLALPWIVTISVKYHKLTYGTSGAYNLSLVGPESTGHPVLTQGLTPPPAQATSAWVDPSLAHVTPWKPSLFPHPRYLSYSRDLIVGNLKMTITTLQSFWPLALGVMLAALAVVFMRGPVMEPRQRRFVALAWLTGLAYLSGYLIVFVEDRYIWLIEVLALVLAGIIVEVMLTGRRFPLWVALGLLGMFYYTVNFQTDTTLKDRRNVNLDIYQASQQLKGLPGFDCHSLASNGYWEISSYMAFHIGCPYYGMTAPLKPEDNSKQINRYQVQYVLMWQTHSKIRDSVPEGYEKVGRLDYNGIEVYRRK